MVCFWLAGGAVYRAAILHTSRAAYSDGSQRIGSLLRYARMSSDEIMSLVNGSNEP